LERIDPEPHRRRSHVISFNIDYDPPSLQVFCDTPRRVATGERIEHDVTVPREQLYEEFR
jgi:hypothetical protein